MSDYAAAAVQSEDFAGRGDYEAPGVRAAGRDNPASPRRWPDARESQTGARLSPYSGAKPGFPPAASCSRPSPTGG